jgi:hypothetical protein
LGKFFDIFDFWLGKKNWVGQLKMSNLLKSGKILTTIFLDKFCFDPLSMGLILGGIWSVKNYEIAMTDQMY